jgi:hypothetical protein
VLRIPIIRHWLISEKHNVTGNPYVKNYVFDFNFEGRWGDCSVTMTSVLGHLTNVDFPRQYAGWASCPPAELFEAPINITVDQVTGPALDSAPQTANHNPGQNSDCRKYKETSTKFQSLIYLDRLRS